MNLSKSKTWSIHCYDEKKQDSITNEYYSNEENNINNSFIQTSSFDEDKNLYKENKINAYFVDHKSKVEDEYSDETSVSSNLLKAVENWRGKRKSEEPKLPKSNDVIIKKRLRKYMDPNTDIEGF